MLSTCLFCFARRDVAELEPKLGRAVQQVEPAGQGRKDAKETAKPVKAEPHSDPEKDFPTATPDEIRQLRVLQEQKKALLEQLRKHRLEKAMVSRQGLGAYIPKHNQEPLLVLDNNRWHVVGGLMSMVLWLSLS